MRPDVCVIVPTVRNPGCVRDYAANARRHGFDTDRLHWVLVTEDHCDAAAMRAMLREEGLSGAVFGGSEREAWFEDRGLEGFAPLIPARSHAQTSFGLLVMWATPRLDFGVFVDDDTRPHPDHDFFATHLRNLDRRGPVETRASDTRWVNVIEGAAEPELYPRGYPYGAMGEETSVRRTSVDRVVASQGLWTDVPDLDAVRILGEGDVTGRGACRLTAGDLASAPFAVARGNYLTVCSMNLAFRREVIPAFYQLPMDDNPWGVGRFDDIWSGVLLKRCCDVAGGTVLTGPPYCRHEKAPRSSFDDLAAEVAGLELNEHLWSIVDGIGEGAGSYRDAYRAMADHFVRGDWGDHRNGAFLNQVGERMRDWLDCLEAIPAVTHPVSADD